MFLLFQFTLALNYPSSLSPLLFFVESGCKDTTIFFPHKIFFDTTPLSIYPLLCSSVRCILKVFFAFSLHVLGYTSHFLPSQPFFKPFFNIENEYISPCNLFFTFSQHFTYYPTASAFARTYLIIPPLAHFSTSSYLCSSIPPTTPFPLGFTGHPLLYTGGGTDAARHLPLLLFGFSPPSLLSLYLPRLCSPLPAVQDSTFCPTALHSMPN